MQTTRNEKLGLGTESSLSVEILSVDEYGTAALQVNGASFIIGGVRTWQRNGQSRLAIPEVATKRPGATKRQPAVIVTPAEIEQITRRLIEHLGQQALVEFLRDKPIDRTGQGAEKKGIQ